ncbi:hypothetical protein D6D23_07569 [Aureobasidium pullulans]|nr:hypothetical protein D6D23_07569 [Aureobasidium pullulans]THW85468.1 hypothetical protein D6D18_07742 [Aureobasidium pullulans]THX86999.1 hypothetical protein D6D04_01103 [Aureobasidium pullulans]THY93431.1 hypothetical protein D6C92_05369 [Aureobasidium pullulans]
MATALMNGMHTAGIYSDMTVDGPEIGTLVAIVDRAKNLPNVKRMGKQNPYCAARLGKEAKKTETDKRGGQTPKWDQELRFTVHDSPDYHNLKLSVFNDDKKTDLIGEAYIGLQDVCIPGGGKHDGWHALNFKGKYAGEINLELTYYDSRPPVEDKRRVSGMSAADNGRRKATIKRRPLPAELTGPPPPGSIVPDHARGPRQLPGRPTEDWTPHGLRPRPQPQHHTQSAPAVQHYDPDELDLDYHPGFHHPSMPELPQLPPSRKHRGSVPAQPTMPHDTLAYDHYGHARSQSIPTLPHSMSSPSVVQSDQGWAEPLPRCLQPTVEDIDEYDYERELPPQPPSHTRNSRSVSRGPPPRSMSVDDYAPPPAPGSYYGSSPNFRASYSGFPPPAPSSVAGSHYRSHSRVASRQSVPDAYTMTPPRAHPLANEMRRSMSPAPSSFAEDFGQQYRRYSNEPIPMARPASRNASPLPPRPASRNTSPLPPRNNLDAIRHPVRTFANSASPSPTRKDVPRPSTSNGNFFSPDDFDSLNPNASSNSPFASGSNPHSPYHIQNSPSADEEAARPLPDPNAKIVGFDGRVIDPSDHLPVHSWAPEPEKKTPTKIYGSNGQVHPNGLAGPRQAVRTPSRMSMGRDVVVNVRTRGSPPKRPMSSASHHSHMTGSPGPGPLSEIDIPNPYAGGSTYGGYDGQYSQYSTPPPPASNSPHYGDVFGKYTQAPVDQYGYGYENGGGGGQQQMQIQQAPVYEQHGYGASALSKEMAKIDIGGSRRPLSRGTVRRGAWP